MQLNPSLLNTVALLEKENTSYYLFNENQLVFLCFRAEHVLNLRSLFVVHHSRYKNS